MLQKKPSTDKLDVFINIDPRPLTINLKYGTNEAKYISMKCEKLRNPFRKFILYESKVSVSNISNQ